MRTSVWLFALGLVACGGTTRVPIVNPDPSTYGMLEGTGTIARDCSGDACSTDLSSLGILIRQNTTTVKALKFNSDGSYGAALLNGQYLIYEDDNDWSDTGLTTSGYSISVAIEVGQTMVENFEITNIKSNQPL